MNVPDAREQRRVEMIKVEYLIFRRLEKAGHPAEGALALAKEIMQILMDSDLPDDEYLKDYEATQP